MGQIQINELPEALSAEDTDLLAVDNGIATKKISIANFNANANATAKYYAEQAEGFATTASNAKDDAVAAKNEAVLQVSNAHDEATAAAGSATDAAGSASSASGYANTARIQAGNAAQSAQSAANSAVGIDDKVKLAQSWAEGNTGARVDEATNNAKYWAGVARSIAGGGVTQFNGRDGEVLPEDGDYDSSMITHTNADGTETDVETEINKKADQSAIAVPETNPATSSHAVGDYIIMGDLLYEVIDSILVGDVINASNTSLIGSIADWISGKEDKATELPQTLTVGSTTLTFQSPSIKANSRIQFFSDPYGIKPINAVGTVGQVVATFDPQPVAVGIVMRVIN